jgi:hypothetical protein
MVEKQYKHLKPPTSEEIFESFSAKPPQTCHMFCSKDHALFPRQIERCESNSNTRHNGHDSHPQN